jgi:hypothetical protein
MLTAWIVVICAICIRGLVFTLVRLQRQRALAARQRQLRDEADHLQRGADEVGRR